MVPSVQGTHCVNIRSPPRTPAGAPSVQDVRTMPMPHAPPGVQGVEGVSVRPSSQREWAGGCVPSVQGVRTGALSHTAPGVQGVEGVSVLPSSQRAWAGDYAYKVQGRGLGPRCPRCRRCKHKVATTHAGRCPMCVSCEDGSVALHGPVVQREEGVSIRSQPHTPAGVQCV